MFRLMLASVDHPFEECKEVLRQSEFTQLGAVYVCAMVGRGEALGWG